MTKYCTECGALNLDESNFCAKCGHPFREYDHSPLDANAPLEIPKKYKLYNIKGTSYCFNCRQESFILLQKEAFLSDKVVYFCTNCGLTIDKSGNVFKLVDILDKNNPMWQSYRMRQFRIEQWKLIANGELSQKDQIKQEKDIEDLEKELIRLKQKRDIESIMPGLIKGEINLPPVDSPVDLIDNEEAYVFISNIKLCEPKINKGTSFETSFKIAKGVTVKSGSNVTSADPKKLKELDAGTFIITNRRVIFLGDEKTANIDLIKILSINVFKDGISIQREDKNKVNYFIGTDQMNLTFTIGGRKRSLALEGNIVRAIILGQMAKL